MNLNKVVERLVEAQNSRDSEAYAACFTNSAVVHDEGKTHTGRNEIQQWIENATLEYQTVLQPLSYDEAKQESLLTAEVSGTFPGSPVVLKFHIGLEGDLIRSLNITG